MYHSRRLGRPFADLIIIAKVATASMIVLECLGHLLPMLGLPRMFMVRFLVISLVALALARLILRFAIREVRRRGHNIKTLVLITTPQIGQRLTTKIEEHAHYGYRVVCHFLYFDQGQDEEKSLVLAVRGYLRETPVDDVILALPSKPMILQHA